MAQRLIRSVSRRNFIKGWRPVGKPDRGASRAWTCQRPAENAQDLASGITLSQAMTSGLTKPM